MPRRKRRRIKRGARPRSPKEVERRYVRALSALNGRLTREVARALRPYLKDWREDAVVETRTYLADFRALRLRLAEMVQERELSPIVDRFGREIEKFNGREMSRILPVDITAETPAVRAVLERLRTANVELIQSIPARLLDDVQGVVTEAVQRGTRVEVLAPRLAERYSVSDSRARLIARDQTLKANSQLTQTRHEAAGVTSYIWSSSRDELVRPIHAELDGFEFKWGEPPITSENGDTNPPGEDYQCRCLAIPVLD